jgi:hypothetical protein
VFEHKNILVENNGAKVNHLCFLVEVLTLPHRPLPHSNGMVQTKTTCSSVACQSTIESSSPNAPCQDFLATF